MPCKEIEKKTVSDVHILNTIPYSVQLHEPILQMMCWISDIMWCQINMWNWRTNIYMIYVWMMMFQMVEMMIVMMIKMMMMWIMNNFVIDNLFEGQKKKIKQKFNILHFKQFPVFLSLPLVWLI